MSSEHPVLTLALGAGGGLALWYLLRDDSRKPPPRAGPGGGTSSAATPSASPGSAAPAPCRLRLTAAGLLADGHAIDIPGAVARCKAAGRAEVTIAGDAPGVIYAQLAAALAEVGVTVTQHRNGRANPHSGRPRRQEARSVDLAAFAAFVAELAQEVEADPTPEGLARGRFGDRKVFIAAIRRGLRGTQYGRLPRAAIDELFIESMRQRLLRLARADLVSAMDSAEVRDSEIRYLNASFHFLISEPPDERAEAVS